MLSDEIPLKRRSRAGDAGVLPVSAVAVTAAHGTAPVSATGVSQGAVRVRPDPHDDSIRPDKRGCDSILTKIGRIDLLVAEDVDVVTQSFETGGG